MCLGKIRLQLQCPAVAGDRFVQLPLVLQRIAQIVVRLGKVRLQLQMPGGSRRSLRPVFPWSFKAMPRLLCASAKSGFSSRARRMAGDRVVQLPLVLERVAQVVVCLGIVRLQLQCPAVAGDGFVQFPLVLQGVAQVVVRLGIVRASVPGPGGSRRSPRPASPGPSTHCPDCMCASAIVRLQFQCPAVAERSLRPVFPGPSRHCPGCCVHPA